jgi:potassium efflux system protein
MKKLFALLVNLFLFASLLAQEATTEKKPEVELKAFNVSEIREAGEKTEKLLKSSNKLATDTANLYVLDTALVGIKKGNKYRVNEDSLYIDYSQLSLWELKNESRYWRDYNNELEAFQEKVNKQVDDLTKTLKEIRELNTRWSLTNKMLDTIDISQSIETSVSDYQERTLKAQEGINNYLDDIMHISERLNDELSRVETVITETEKMRGEKAKSIFSQDAKPLFIAFKNTDTGFMEALQIGLNEGWDELVTYVKDKKNQVIYHLLFIALLMGMFYWLSRKFYQSSIAKDDVYKEISSILNRPLISGLALGIILAGFFYGAPPKVFINVLIIIGIIPIVYLLPRVIQYKLHYFWFFLVTVVFLEKLAGLLTADQAAQRLLLFITGIISIAGFTYALLPRSDFYRAIKAKSKSLALFIMRILLLLVVVSVVFNLRGSYQLSVLLMGGVVQTFVVGILVFIAVRITQAALFVLIRTGFFGHARILEKYTKEAQWWAFTLVSLYGLFLWFRSVLSNFALLNPFLDAYEAILDTSWQFGEVTLSVSNMVDFVIIIAIFWLIANVVNLLIKEELLPRFDIRKGLPLAIGVLSRYFILFLGFVLAMAAAGISLSKLNLIIGAVGVGIGFGLQSIVSNLVSGLVIIFERPIHIGDVVTAGQLEGEVTDIGLRSSRIRTWEGAEVIVPNNNLVAKEVTNWTYSDKRRRVERIVLIDSGPNPRDVKRVIDAVVKKQEGLIDDDQAQAYFLGYENNALKFRVLLWMHDNILRNPSELLLNLHDALTANGYKPYIPVQKLIMDSEDSKMLSSNIIGAKAQESKEDTKKNEPDN